MKTGEFLLKGIKLSQQTNKLVDLTVDNCFLHIKPMRQERIL